MRLYELADNYRQVEDMLNATCDAAFNGDEQAADETQIWKDTLDSINAPLEEKALAVAALIRERKAAAEAIKAERQRLEKRQRAAERAEESLRSYLAGAMQVTGKTKIKDDRFTVSLGEGKPKVVVTDLTKLIANEAVWKPYKFEETNLDKTAIKAMFEEGQVVPGADLITEKVLSIR